jgi:hypothetical protein
VRIEEPARDVDVRFRVAVEQEGGMLQLHQTATVEARKPLRKPEALLGGARPNRRSRLRIRR